MTREELLKEIDFIQKWLYDLEICGEDLENSLRAIKNKVIEAFEKEDVLDKIRTEIENHCGLIKENHCRYCSYCNCVMGVREILEIIEKYKAESEDKG